MDVIDLLDLFASLTLDSSQYESGLKKAETQGRHAADNITVSMKSGSKAASEAAVSIGTSMSGGIKTVASGATTAVKSVASGVKTIVSTTANAAKTIAQGAVAATSKVADAVANVGKLAAGITTAGLGVASAATVKLGKDALDAYGEYEQLAGGIETLFGENSEASHAIKAFADGAFQTVQMSANDYMATVTDFSATLLQKLDPTEAANKADQALRQMADNANKMGTAISSVQDAYKGLAKSNATMLDNLKLGYGGNQGELARLLNDSGVLGDVVADEKNVWDVASFDKIIDAIGVIQERLGMMGVSQEEALHTIQGSISMTRAAWQNLITGWANPDADLESLTDNLMVSLDALQDNAVPAIQRILKSMGTAVVKFAPSFRERLTALITDTAPDLLEGAGELLSQLGGVILDTLPTLVTTASTALSKLLSRAMSAIRSNSSEIRAGARALVTSLFDGLRQLVAAGDIKGVAATVTDTLIDVLGIVASNAPELITALFDVIQTVISTALSRIKDDPQGFVRAVGEILGAIIGGIAGMAGELAPQVGATITSLMSQGFGVVDLVSLGERVQATLGGLFGVDISPETVAEFCGRTVNAIANGLAPAIETAIPTVSAFMASLAETFTSEENLTAFTDAAGRILGAICGGIHTAAENGDVATFRTSVVSAVTHFVEWLTDEEQMQKLQGAGLALLGGLADGLGEDTQALVDAAGTAVDNIVSHLTSDWNLAKIIDGVLTILANIALGVYNGLVDIVAGGIEWIANQANGLFFGGDEYNAENIKSNSEDFKDFFHADYLGKDDIYKGFRNMEYSAGLVSEADWAESMKDYNEEAARVYNERRRAEMANWDLKKDPNSWSLDDLNAGLTINQTIELDGEPVAKSVRKHDSWLTAQNGY